MADPGFTAALDQEFAQMNSELDTFLAILRSILDNNPDTSTLSHALGVARQLKTRHPDIVVSFAALAMIRLARKG